MVKILELKIMDKENNCYASFEDTSSVNAVYEGEYNKGDKIFVSSDSNFLAVRLDEAMCESIVYVPNGSFYYEIPFDLERSSCYEPNAFFGNAHKMSARIPSDEEIYSYRMISRNSHDLKRGENCYPHTSANFVTRDEPCFYERNAIDGICDNSGHGNFPYHSWAGGAREDILYTMDFGKEVAVDKIVFYLRAQFPHDTYWKSLDIEFDDKSTVSANFLKTADAQTVTFDTKKTRYIRLVNFKQATFPLSWAALSQIEVYGKYTK